MRKFLTFWLAALMLVSMMLPTALAAGDAAAAPAEGTEEITAEGEEEGAVKDAEVPKDDTASAILTTTATSIPTSTALKTVCYPTAIDVRDEGAEIRKIYDLSPEADPAGIPRIDFEHAGFSCTFVDLLKQERPEYEERSHTESVTLNSKKKDMESVLSLLPEQKEFVTINEQIQNLTKADRQSRRPEWKGRIRPRPQEKKKCARARISNRRSMALADLTIKLFKPM